MALFRRLRRGRDEPDAGEAPPEPPPEPEPLAPELPPVTEPDAAPEAGTEAPSPTPLPLASPPPLPQRTVIAPAHPGVERGPFGSCFVCGTPLEGGTCPTCRITWME